MDCLFCNIIKGNIPSKTLYEDDTLIVIMDAYPDTDGHCLIIPKKHITDFMELDEKSVLHMHKIAQKMIPLLLKKLNVNTLTLMMNYGNAQVIKHVHLHLLPNYPRKSKSNIDEIFAKLTDK